MAAPVVRASTAPAAGLTGTSHADTAIGDAVVVVTWERSVAGIPVHTLQSGFTEIFSQQHNESTRDGRLSIAWVEATVAGAQSYAAYTSDIGTSTWSATITLEGGTYEPSEIAAFNAGGADHGLVSNPSGPGLVLAQGRDFLSLTVVGFHLGTTQDTGLTAPTNYTELWEVAGSTNGEVSAAQRTLTGATPGQVEDPGGFGEAFSGSWSGCAVTLLFGSVLRDGPAFRAQGTTATGIGAVTPAAHTSHQTNDIELLVCESANEAVTLSDAQGFDAVPGSPQGTASDPATRLTVFWRRYDGAQTDPTVADPGDHVSATIHTFAHCASTGNPWNVISSGTDDVTTLEITGATTTVDDCLVVAMASHGQDTTVGIHSGWANADLTGVVEHADYSVTDGNGGGIGMATGIKTTAGAYGDTTMTRSLERPAGFMTIALMAEGPVVVDAPTAVAEAVAPAVAQIVTAPSAVAEAVAPAVAIGFSVSVPTAIAEAVAPAVAAIVYTPAAVAEAAAPAVGATVYAPPAVAEAVAPTPSIGGITVESPSAVAVAAAPAVGYRVYSPPAIAAAYGLSPTAPQVFIDGRSQGVVQSARGRLRRGQGALGPVAHQFTSPSGDTCQVMVGGWEATEIAPGGYESASGRITEADYEKYREVFRFGTTWRTFLGESGECIWGGRLLEPAVSRNGVGAGVAGG